MGKLRLSGKERRRVEVLTKVKRGDIPLTKAAELLGVCYRQVLRIWRRYESEGSVGLKHGLRDRVSNRRIEVACRERVLELYQAKYGDFGPTLAVEYLRKCDGEELSEETLRRWLIAAGLWQARRQGSRHRKWRERRAHWGEMVQMDGSEHDWFEGRRERASLMVLIDDATNWTYAKFFESETTAAAMRVFWEYVERYGLPRALYVDRDSIYETTRDSTVEEALKDVGPLTQFGRAMKELDVELILARSPQAKGRVERRHGVFQDRFVKALRLKKIATLAEANEYLESEFLEELNERFSVEARSAVNLHRPLARGVKLEHVLSYQEERVVQNDWTVSWCNRIFQLAEGHQKLSLARKKILVSELLDGTIRLTSRGESLSWMELPERPVSREPKARERGKQKAPYKPAANHWRGPRRSGEKI
jgi:Helix-turn-helix domain